MMKIGNISVNTDNQYILDRVWSQVQTNSAYLRGRLRGYVQVDGEKYQWLLMARGSKDETL